MEGTQTEKHGTPLEIVNGVPKLAHAVDYSQNPNLLKYLKKGDLIYEPEAGWSITGHTALVVDIAYDATYQQEYVLVVEAVSHAGVCYGVLTPNRFNSLKPIIKRVKTATQAQINSAVDWACNQVGKDYFLNLTTKDADPNNRNWYCSELVWAAFYWQGIYLDQNDNEETGGSVVMPHEINADADLTTIMQHGKTTTITSNGAAMHTITCNSETFTEKHTYITYNSSQVICTVCDHIHTHSYTYRSCGDGSNHRKVCTCGISTMETCFGITSGGITTCKKCGQKITGFVPTITSTDDEKKNKKG